MPSEPIIKINIEPDLHIKTAIKSLVELKIFMSANNTSPLHHTLPARTLKH